MNDRQAIDPQAEVARLAESRTPYLIGVRHHSPALAAVMPALLTAADPEVLLVELPADLAEWIPWLAHPDTIAPVALAAAGSELAFYPFADFSPELVAIRWAATRDIPVVCCDLPVSQRPPSDAATKTNSHLTAALRRTATGRTGDDLWDRLVEARAHGAEPEQLRRAALAYGWAVRHEQDVSARDLAREAHMRDCLDERRAVAVVGAFHATALLSGDPQPLARGTTSVTTSLVAYSFDLLDERSGYPAGIRDPEWQQSIVDGRPVDEAVARFAVGLCAAVRRRGHPAGPGEAREIARVASSLASLRGLPAPGRGEFVEAVESVLTQGELHGRGRVIASAMQEILVGRRRGRLASGTPVSGLLVHVRDLITELRLPTEQTELRLDPLRSILDRRREIALRRMLAAGIGYGTSRDVNVFGPALAMSTSWTVEWGPTAEASAAFAGLRGVTLEQAAAGAIRAARTESIAADRYTPAAALAHVRAAAECGLLDLLEVLSADLVGQLSTSGLARLVEAIELLEQIMRGHVPGVPTPPDYLPALADALLDTAVRQLDGSAGSDDPADARALLALVHRDELPILAVLRRMAADGSPLMRAAAGYIVVYLGQDAAESFAARVESWVVAASTPDLRHDLSRALAGLLTVSTVELESGSPIIDALCACIESLDDTAFLARLPALRRGFDVASTADRARLEATIGERIEGGLDLSLAAEPELLAQWAAADLTAGAALESSGLRESAHLAPAERWALILGRRPATREARRVGRALDELYGAGHGEGAGQEFGATGGDEAPYPTAREWSGDLESLFGARVRDEVLAASGRADALLQLDPSAIRPSVELLRDILSLAGSMSEGQLARLRPLVRRCVDELAVALANRLRPALTGLVTQRPSRRPSGPLDLRRTLAANLRTAQRGPDGVLRIVPERPIFATRARRHADWHVIVVTDVSGSMERSVIWSALTASVLASVPTFRTSFLTFSTEVIDLSEHLDDPLALLLEVRVGGGTDIAQAVRYARSLVRRPSRTLVVVISDFEEGGAIGTLLAEVAELVGGGSRALGVAALDDTGAASYSAGAAQALAQVGMPVAALSPLELAGWIADQVKASS